MSKKIDIEELFRNQLGEAEIPPSPGAWKAVHRKLRYRKFLKFDPGSFNIYYLGALLVAGSVTVALLAPGRETKPSMEPVIEQVESGQALQIEKPAPFPASRQGKQDRSTRLDGRKMETGERSSAPAGNEKAKLAAEPENSSQIAGKEEITGGEEAGTGDVQKVRPTLVTYFTPSEISGCAPLEVSFLNTSVNAVSFHWSFGTGEVSTERSPDYTFTDPGTYRVSLRAFGEDGNSLEYSEEVEVYPAPRAAFEVAPGLTSFDGGSSLEMVNYTTGAVSYRWEMIPANREGKAAWSSEEFQPVLRSDLIQDGPASIRMVATSFEGCTDTAVAELKNVEAAGGPDVKFPTAFEANHTGPSGGTYGSNEIRADLFHPHFTQLPAEYHLQIFTRTGEMIFETRNVYQGWDGYIMQERASTGVYLWVAEGKWANGKTFSRKGDVTLLWSDRHWP